jgi:DNA-binding CsgD family transcriptional regulator
VVADQFISAGFHYRVLRKPVENSNDAPVLTKREADAVELACSGLSNKRIAIELDVSPSTVGVLLFRAAAKLRVKSRTELIAAYRRLRGL